MNLRKNEIQNRLSEISETDLKRDPTGVDVVEVDGGGSLDIFERVRGKSRLAVRIFVAGLVNERVKHLAADVVKKTTCTSAYSPRSRVGKADRWR